MICRLILLPFLLMLSFIRSAAQDTKPDQLHVQLLKATTDSGRAGLLIKLGWEYRNSNTDSAIYFANQGLVLAEKVNDDKKIARAKYQLGRCYYTKGDDSIARNFFNESLIMYEKLKDTANMATAHMQLGYCFSRVSRDADMLTEFLQSLSLAEAIKNDDRVSDALYSISDYYIQREQYQTAVGYLLESLQIDNKKGNKTNIASDYQYLGLCYSQLNQFKLSEGYLVKAIDIFGELNDNFRLAAAHSYMAELYLKMKTYSKALEHYLIALGFLDSLGAKNECANISNNIAKLFLAKKDYNNALKYAKQGEIYAEKINATLQLHDLYASIAEASAGLHDYKSGYEYLNKASDLNDTITQREENDKLAEMQTRFETEKKEKENLILKAQNETANANLQRNQVFLIAAIFGIFLLGGFLYLIYKNKKGKERHIEALEQLNAQLRRQKDEIGKMNTSLQLKNLRAQMNPHFIFNCMSSIQECILLGHVDDANRYLAKLSKLLRMVLLYAEEESITLDKELQMLDLYLQLESVRLKQNFEYRIEVDENIFPEEVLVPTLILQPFAENAIWHGLQHKETDRKLTIRILAEKNLLYCTVEDNGVGRLKAAQLMQMKTHHESKGLKIVNERLQILQQKTSSIEPGFKIIDLSNELNEPSGTKIELTLPLTG